MVMRPVILSPSFSAFRSLSSCTASAVGLNESCAAAGCATTNSNANAAHRALRIEALWAAALGIQALRVECDLALAETVGAVLGVLSRSRVCLRHARAIGALVHLAARPEVSNLRVLRRAERTGVEAVAAAYAEILGVKHHAVSGGVEARHRADRGARRIRTVHAGHRHRAFAGLAVVNGDDTAAIDAPRHFMFVLAGRHAGVALDATVGITEKFDASHDLFSPHAALI